MTTEIDIAASLAALKDRGLTFSHCVELFGTKESPYIRGAKTRDGEIKVDEPTVVSEGDDHGAYVMAWIWVNDTDVWEGKTDSMGEPCRTLNKYECTECDQIWESQWSCACNDECSGCGHEIEPYEIVDLDLNGDPEPT